MHSAYHTLRAVAETLYSRLRGRTLEDAYSQDRDEVVLAFSNLPDRLIISCRPETLCVYLHPSLSRARRNSANVLAGSSGRVLQEVSLHPADRVLSLRLSGECTLVIQLFGTRANVLQVAVNGEIIDAFKRSRQLAGQKLAETTVHPFLAPSTLATIVRRFPEQPIGTVLRKHAPHLPSSAIREILFRSGLGLESTGGQLTDDRHAVLIEALSAVFSELEHPQPRIYVSTDGTPSLFSLIPLSACPACREDRFDDIHAALRSFIAWKRSADNIADERRSLEQRLHSSLDHSRRVVRAIETDLAARDRAELYMEYGRLILEHLPVIPTGSSSADIPAPDGTVTIPLQPMLSPSQNAQRYFEKAKASKRARQLAEHRLQVYQRRSLRDTALLSDLEQVHTRQDLKAYMDRHNDELNARRKAGPTDDQDHPLFRTFTVEGGFEVWAGKSSANNDVLTLRHAKPQDYWFHARGVSGSHVILRVATGRGAPGKQAIRQAASIAAYYSKMRTASLVPVAVTLRKYVHKPKGAAPGSVALQREDVIMVEPVLPQSAEDDDEQTKTEDTT